MAEEEAVAAAAAAASLPQGQDYTLLLIVLVSVLGAVIFTFVGHKKFFTNLVVGSLLAFIGTAFLILEVIFLALTPIRMLTAKPRDPNASITPAIENRKIVLFDGVPDPQLVNFLPYQDELSNPHVNLKRLKEEFPQDLERVERIADEICVISGDKIFWGAESVMEVCAWMYAPFPITKMIGSLFPKRVRDLIYNIVSRNRKDWFGTQDIEINFAKGLCPYIQARNFIGSKKE